MTEPHFYAKFFVRHLSFPVPGMPGKVMVLLGGSYSRTGLLFGPYYGLPKVKLNSLNPTDPVNTNFCYSGVNPTLEFTLIVNRCSVLSEKVVLLEKYGIIHFFRNRKLKNFECSSYFNYNTLTNFSYI